MTDEVERKLTKLEKTINGSKKNASSIGMSAAVILSWLVTTFAGVPVPAEVVAATAGLMTAIATNIQNGGNK